MRLKSIEIHGFRRKNIIAKLELSQNQFSFMYGVNGKGKTTFLELIYAIFDKNTKRMIAENVTNVKIIITDNEKDIDVYVTAYIEDNEIHYDWEEFDKNNLNEFNVLYITTQRSLNEYRENITVEMLAYYLKNNKDITIDYLSPYYDLANLCNFINGAHDEKIMENFKKKNVCINSLRISDVGKLIYNNYIEQKYDLKIQQTNSMSNILKICLKYLEDREQYLKKENNINLKYSSQLSKSDEEVLRNLLGDNIQIVLSLIKLERQRGINYSIFSKVKSEITKYINYRKRNKSIDLFSHITGKNIYLSKDNIEIEYNNEFHSLTKLSHGERHLLTLLTLIDFIGNNKNIILIDEPCIALDTDWQEQLVENFSQITSIPFLIATHSPYISQDYLFDQIQISGGLK